MTGAWRCEGHCVHLGQWENAFGVFAAVTTRPSGNMKDPGIFDRQVRAAGLDPHRWAGGQQVHGRRVVPVARPRIKEKGRTDGMVTQSPGLALRIFTADCIPVFLIDPVHRAIGLVHAGWRGVQKGIVTTAIQSLSRHYHSRAGEVCVAFGPHMGACCYEVGVDVASVFQGIPGAVSRSPRPEEKTKLNLSVALRSQLEKMGVRRDKIIPAPGCTVCDQKYFSYRRDRTDERQVALFAMAGGRGTVHS
ncbi:MAG: peptidoglycan editing factor PgeF [Elusimicrobia bacterium]|nr:peptidoglycan editing factor PgeF [Elusimicrobiota bacterium]